MHCIRLAAMRIRAPLAALLAVAALLAAPAAVAASAAQKVFDTPQQAAGELAAATKSHDSAAMLAILGANAATLVFSGDAVADRAAEDRFAQAYEESHRIEMQGDAKATLAVGKDDWPFPFPLVKSQGGWRFNAREGREEVLTRRIGRNELSVMQVLQAYVDAQQEYYLRNPDQGKLLAYAQKVGSTKGKRDGLYYPVNAGEPPSPLGTLFASAQAEGYRLGSGPEGKPVPYHGYIYRILKAQGPAAKDGAYDYVVHGKMIGGFALVAYPAAYANSGVMTFIVNHDGVAYQKDLGPSTSAVASKMTRFDPVAGWKPL
ncbi:DUF2950 domain-containing protein [Ramlibacter monticola]|uniref:DUF2950 domain-containing protein n=1 Tax=Ramlibacter monticola TaxID=1926872 RepID=A0A936Z1Z3_9BURK|nr:DUF2950 domain-containing protein [Ramlibacter monticola]MBL0392429.1 DUF2950 domain-containing protein [Ramlibacter monticola]